MSASAIIPGIPLEQRQAADKYRDAMRITRAKEKAKKPKGDSWDVRWVKKLSSWAVSAVVYWNDFIAGAWVMWLAKKAPKYYPLVKSFVKAHAGGPTTMMERIERKGICDQCPYRYDYEGREWCRGDNDGKGCGCGHWRPANLKHKRRLAAFKCPQGKFGYGGLVQLVVRR